MRRKTYGLATMHALQTTDNKDSTYWLLSPQIWN